MRSRDGLIDADNVKPGGVRDVIAVRDDYLDMPSDTEEPDPDLEQQFSLEKNNEPPVLDEIVVPCGHLLPVNKQKTPLDSAHSGPANDNSDPHVSFGLKNGMFPEILRDEAAARLYELGKVIAFSDEEGVRFQSTFLESAAIAGVLPFSTLQIPDKSGLTLQNVLKESLIDTTEKNLSQLKYEQESVLGYVEMDQLMRQDWDILK